LSLLLCTLLAIAVGGCTIEPFADPIPVPAGYVPPGYQPYVYTAPAATRPVEATAHAPTTSAAIVAPPIAANDPVVRDQVLANTRAAVARRFGVDKNPQLNEYLILVGSLLTINTLNSDAEYTYVLLNSDEPLAFALPPKTIYISKGLLHQMEDESELAGALAREISNLVSMRALQAAALPTTPEPTTRPTTQPALNGVERPLSPAQTAAVNRLTTRLTDILTKDGFSPEQESAADVEGARLAAAAKYAPDGYLRFLTRLKKATTPAANWSTWERIKSLDHNVQIIAKAFPHADVRLPVRFETYVKLPPIPVPQK
jgi:predicted Zn-dependent protease